MRNKRDLRRRKSIKGKIMGSTYIAILMLTVVCVSIMAVSMRTLTKTILLDNLQPMAQQASKTVESNLHLLADRMMTLAGAQSMSASEEEKSAALVEARNQYELFTIAVYDLSGNVLAKDGVDVEEVDAEELFSLLVKTDNLVIGDPVAVEDTLAIPIGMPVKENGETAGYLLGYYKYDALKDVLGSISVGKTGSILIINQEGTIVGHSVLEMVKSAPNIFELDKGSGTEEVYKRMLSGETGSAEGKIKGKDAFIAFAPVRGTYWSLAVEVPQADYLYITNCAIFITVIVSVLMLVLGLILVYRQTNKVSAVLGKVTDRITQFSEGDLHTPFEVAETRDELELLSGSMKTTVESINTYLEEIQEVLLHIAQGDLDVCTSDDYQGDFVVIRDSLSNIINALNEVLHKFHYASDRLSGMADKLSRQSGELQNASVQQSNTVGLLAEKLTGVKGGLDAVSQNTTMTKSKIDEIAERIADGNDQMQHLSQAMDHIHQNAAEISKISKLIEDIAFQTNVLSLNAAVEAARAGSAGSGFAVVADEVRSLANQSAEAAKNTSEMIMRSTAMIQTGVSLTNDLRDAFQQIEEVSNTIESISGQLAQTVEKQEQSISEITEYIGDISLVADQNRENAEDTAQVSREVSSEAEHLHEMLRYFRLRGEENMTKEER